MHSEKSIKHSSEVPHLLACCTWEPATASTLSPDAGKEAKPQMQIKEEKYGYKFRSITIFLFLLKTYVMRTCQNSLTEDSNKHPQHVSMKKKCQKFPLHIFVTSPYLGLCTNQDVRKNTAIGVCQKWKANFKDN